MGMTCGGRKWDIFRQCGCLEDKKWYEFVLIGEQGLGGGRNGGKGGTV